MTKNRLQKIPRLVIAVLLALIGAVSFAPAASAETPRVFDELDLFTDAQVTSLNARLAQIAAKYDLDVVAATVGPLAGKSAQLYAADFYEAHGFGKDGAILILSLDQRDWGFAATGRAEPVFTLEVQDRLADVFLPHFRLDMFYSGFSAWADEMDRQLSLAQQARNQSAIVAYVVVGLIGLGVAFAVPLVWTIRHKSIRGVRTADAYVKGNGFHVTAQQDQLVNTSVTRTAIPQSDSYGGSSSSSSSGISSGSRNISSGGSFSSSSGTRFTGSSGKF
ncbi:MAG: TPM domain-containing protein [Propionibacteriaceae bacterium]|nr:TPM domain-containing protein [Propionibacteriaceae bacterium]